MLFCCFLQYIVIGKEPQQALEYVWKKLVEQNSASLILSILSDVRFTSANEGQLKSIATNLIDSVTGDLKFFFKRSKINRGLWQLLLHGPPLKGEWKIMVSVSVCLSDSLSAYLMSQTSYFLSLLCVYTSLFTINW